VVCTPVGYIKDYISDVVDFFLGKLSGERILDLGSGPGEGSQYFKDKGFKAVSLDISKSMVGMCSEKDLEVVQGDYENIPFRGRSFDGVWAYTSLLHVPKTIFPEILWIKISNARIKF